MSPKKNEKDVIAICIQEPFEDGSQMDFGVIQGAELKFLHQAFITDTVSHAFGVSDADVRLYYIDSAERKKLVKIVTDYLKKKLSGDKAKALKGKFSTIAQDKERWGIRIEKIFEDCFKAGYENILLVGSRTPTVSAEKMTQTLKMLRKSDAVFGPTPEGRYYLIGMSGNDRIKMSKFDWKSPSIYSEVGQAFTEKKLAWSEMEIWYAVETSDDLEMMARDINQFRFEGDDETSHETELVFERILERLEI
ncbi:MAG: hypothetical protein DRP35_00945 [Candidatus Zixiibacteriota bacterium]|nr:MAG: hypothetical protein DRP35_00945 [candidate division Zixibacteria bacterium]